MCKYEMDLANIVENTERTRFGRETDRQADGRTIDMNEMINLLNFRGKKIVYMLKMGGFPNGT